MIDFLYTLDLQIFYFINHTISNPFLDKLFPFLTDVKNWYLVYIVLWGLLFFKGGKLGKLSAIAAILLITASDQMSSNLLKNFFERIRPCNDLPDVNLLVFCSGSYSMPSSHAVNNFAIAAFFSRIYPKYFKILFGVAVIIALTRPYVGVHYPSDIIAGAIIGFLLGYLFSYIVLKIKEFQKW